MKLTDLRWPLELAARLGMALAVPVVVVGLLVLVVPVLTALPEGVAIRLAGTDVTEQDLESRIDGLEGLYGIAPPTEDPARDQFYREAARAIAVSIVIERAATERGIVISEKETQDAVSQLVETRFATGGREEFVRLLGEVGTSMQNVLDEIERQRSFTLLFEQVTNDVPEVTEADARLVYDTYPDRMVTPEQRRIGNLVVDSREEADDVVARAGTGTDFAALVSEVSIDPSARDTAGDLGFVVRSQLVEPFGETAFAAAPGSLFGPVRTQAGWNVGKVVEVRPGTPLAFKVVQEQLRSELREEREFRAWNAWLVEQLDRAAPQYADRYRPEDPVGVPAVPPPSATGEPLGGPR